MEEQESITSTELQNLLASSDGVRLQALLSELGSNELARALADLPNEESAQVLALLEPSAAARFVEAISEAQAVSIFAELDTPAAALVMNLVESDEQADLLALLEPEQAEAILSEMDQEEAIDVRRRIQYDPQTAGGLMVTEFLQHSVEATAGEVIEFLRQHQTKLSEYSIQYVFVSDTKGLLIGVLRLRDLVFVLPDTPVAEIMLKDPVAVTVDTDLVALEEVFDRYRFIGIPVVDEFGQLAGVVRRSDVLEAIGDRSDSDYLKASGILGGEELRTMPTALRSRRRLSWLSINIVLNICAASVIAFYQDTLEAVIALAVFLPIISDMSGCSGSQAVAVSVRELTLGLVQAGDMFRVWLKEVAVGCINGLVLGVLLGMVAWMWKANPYLGGVVGVALAVNTVIAVSIGGVVPLLLTKFKKDPALASGPILTTITDMCGFFIVLTLASLLLPYLST